MLIHRDLDQISHVPVSPGPCGSPRPSPVRSRISSRSNIAIAARSVESNLPCGVDVFHSGSYQCGRSDLHQLTGRTAKPIKFGHQNDITWLEASHELGKLWAIGAHAADLLTVDLLVAPAASSVSNCALKFWS
jgi:hypothetical protein